MQMQTSQLWSFAGVAKNLATKVQVASNFATTPNTEVTERNKWHSVNICLKWQSFALKTKWCEKTWRLSCTYFFNNFLFHTVAFQSSSSSATNKKLYY